MEGNLPTESDIDAYADKLDEAQLSDGGGEAENNSAQQDDNPEESATPASQETGEETQTEKPEGVPEGGEDQTVPYQRFREINERMKQAEARAKELEGKTESEDFKSFNEKKDHYKRLDAMDRQLGEFFQQNPAELSRLQGLMQAKEGEVNAQTQQVQQQVDTYGEADPKLVKDLQDTRAQVQQMKTVLDKQAQQENYQQQVVAEEQKLTAEIGEFKSDPVYGKYAEDGEFMKQAMDLALARREPFDKVALGYAEFLEGRRNAVLKELADTNPRRNNAKVERGGGAPGTPAQERAPIGSDAELDQMMEKYGVDPEGP